MEGGVYLCSWTATERGFTIVLNVRPSITATGETFEEAEERFCIALGEQFGDGEPNLEYDRPPPRAGLQQRYLGPDIIRVVTPRGFAVDNSTAVFRHDQCPACGLHISLRTDEPISCGPVPRGCAGASVIAFDATRTVGHGRLQIFSEAFLALLSDEERSGLRLRPVHLSGPGRQRYFEIRGVPVARTVGVRGFPGLLRRKCRTCGCCCFTYLVGTDMFSFLALGDLPSPLPTVFVVEDEHQWLHLCLPRQRFDALRALTGARGLQSAQIYVAPDREVIRDNDEEDYPDVLLSPRCGRPLAGESRVPCARSGCEELAMWERDICLYHVFKG